MNELNAHQIVTIGIPVYKAAPSALELFSFDRCCVILGKYIISLITHRELNIEVYVEKLLEYKIVYEIQYFDRSYFRDLAGYNRLMVSPYFYEAFSTFQYILIYQLDAFVFSDQLHEWCEKKYDYIGAPWLNIDEWNNKSIIDKKLPYFVRSKVLFKLWKGKDGLVGNGGFSLRKVATHIKFARVYNPFFAQLKFNEDIFWGRYIAAKERTFKIPSGIAALAFSIENAPAKQLKLLDYKLPFGCHAWYKNEKDVWINIFKKVGINNIPS